MSKGFEPAFVPIVEVERVSSNFEKSELGQWYWVKNDDPSKEARLMCVMEIGSNYVQLQTPESRGGYSYDRVHRDDFDEKLAIEPNADHQIQKFSFTNGEVRLPQQLVCHRALTRSRRGAY